MHKKLIALLLTAVIAITLCSCFGDENHVAAECADRFTFERVGQDEGMFAYIITDTETGTQYICVKAHGHGCGLTVLQPPEEGAP